jgi:hypothetical protein
VFKPDLKGLATDQLNEAVKGNTGAAGDIIRGLFGGKK